MKKHKEYGKRVSQIILHENDLTNHRLTWLLVTQGILFSASAQFIDKHPMLFAAICIVGLLTTWSFGYALKNSFDSRQYLRREWKAKLEKHDLRPSQLPPLDGAYPNSGVATWKQPWLLVPKVILAAWFVMLWHGLF